MRAFTKFPTSVGSVAKLVPEKRSMLKQIPAIICVRVVVMISSQYVCGRVAKVSSRLVDQDVARIAKPVMKVQADAWDSISMA